MAKWTSRPIPTRRDSTHFSYVTDLIVSGTTVYGTADGESRHWFDGRFAAKASNGNLIWLDNCYGATHSGFVQGKVFYSVGHAHDCRSIKAFPETDPPQPSPGGTPRPRASTATTPSSRSRACCTGFRLWSLKGLSFDDTGLEAGSVHIYKITVTDPFGNIRYSAGSAPVTVHSRSGRHR